MSSKPTSHTRAAPKLARVVADSVPPPPPGSLLLTRQQAARALNCSAMTLIRAEWRGDLKAIKLTPSRNARTYYRADAISALAQGGGSAHA